MTAIRGSQPKPSTTTTGSPSYELSEKWRAAVFRLDESHSEKLPKVLVELEKWGKSALRNERRPVRSIVLTGPTGTGKTTMCERLLQWLDSNATDAYCKGWWPAGAVPSSQRVFWPDVAQKATHHWEDFRNDAMNAHWLFLDDIGAECDRFRNQETVERLQSILEKRKNRWNIITTNISSADWATHWDNRVASRLSAFARISLAGVTDYRRK